MAMDARMDMITATEAHMRLSQWLSPAFPVSSYAYSHGLEAEISDGRVTDAKGITAWIAQVLRAGAGHVDAVLMLAARRGDAPDDVSDLAKAMAGSRERLEETMDQGRALSDALAALGEGDGVARPYPVVLGTASRDLPISDAEVAALYLQSFASALISAAVRFMPLGQTEGQKILVALRPTILAAVEKAQNTALDQMATAVFSADLAAMRHETQEVRIFRT